MDVWTVWNGRIVLQLRYVPGVFRDDLDFEIRPPGILNEIGLRPTLSTLHQRSNVSSSISS